jgi:hypothetical protein
VFVADVDAAREADVAIADHNLAVRAEVHQVRAEACQGDRIEAGQPYTGFSERPAKPNFSRS